MRPRGWLAVGVLALVSSAVTPIPATAASLHDGVLTLSIPGPFRGCGYFGADTNESLRAVLDLVRPSAFLTNPDGTLSGEVGPITSAELVSLNPQTVTYTVAPGWTWSNGADFSIADLESWEQQATLDSSSLADGYRDIATFTPSPTGTQLTAVFATPYADWNTLFRDVDEQGTPPSCSLDTLAAEPSLGPYTLRSMTPTRAVLTRNRTWLGAPAVFNTVVVDTTTPGAAPSSASVVDYAYAPSPEEVTALAGDPGLDGSTGTSDQLAVVGFSPLNALTRQLAVRRFLSLALDRQSVINTVAGPISYDPGLADSALYAQGQVDYAGPVGLGPLAQGSVVSGTTMPTMTDEDCVSCAAPILRSAGFVRRGRGWVSRDGSSLAITVDVGPSATDQATARDVIAQWRAAGVTVQSQGVQSNLTVARDVRAGLAAAGVFTVTTSSTPGLTARSWSGRLDTNTYDLGWRSSAVTQNFLVAQDTFNPDDAATNYANIDTIIAAQAWERPLFTEPTILMWSSELANVAATTSLTGLVDESPTWGIVPQSGSR